MPTYCASRALFEYVVRQQVRDREHIHVRDNHQFLNYLTADEDSSVVGVRFRDETGDQRTLAADLVVDATGRASKTPAWLADNGYAAADRRGDHRRDLQHDPHRTTPRRPSDAHGDTRRPSHSRRRNNPG